MHSFSSRIFLIGMPGSGKSTLGSSLADHLGANFYDLDAEIEDNEKKSISQIFELNGEEYFRKSEFGSLSKLATIELSNGAVIATGGGTPCFFDGLKLMNNAGITIFLDVSRDTLIDRLMSSDLELRPKFGNKQGLTNHISKLYAERRPVYQKADFVLSDDNIQVEDLIEIIKNV